jgi:molybdate transport repressor ModE-like protein
MFCGGQLNRTSFSQSRDRSGVAAGQGSVLTKFRLRDMELLLAIHEHKSITSAALQLGLTQPAASRALRDMEQLLRVHLFERDRAKGMSLTAAGELVLTRARALLADYRSMTMELDAYRAGTGGHLRLGVIPFVPGLLIENLITELIGAKHRMSVSLTEGSTTQLIEDLRMQKLDAVIGRCSTAPIPAGLTQETLFRQEACLLAHVQNPLIRKERIRLADLGGFVWLLPPQGTPSRMAINEAFAAARLSPPVATVEAGSTKIIHLAISANSRMLGIVPSDVGHYVQRLGGVRHLPFPVSLSMPPVGLVWATRHRDTPVVRNVRSNVRELLRKRRAA